MPWTEIVAFMLAGCFRRFYHFSERTKISKILWMNSPPVASTVVFIICFFFRWVVKFFIVIEATLNYRVAYFPLNRYRFLQVGKASVKRGILSKFQYATEVVCCETVIYWLNVQVHEREVKIELFFFTL